MQQAPIVDVVQNTAGRVDPTYLNLDWVFYQIYKALHFILDLFGIVRNKNGSFDFSAIIGFIKLIASVLVVFFIFIILYSLVRLYEMHAEDNSTKTEPEKIIPTSVSHFENARFQKIINHTNSESSAEWRLAIIEADTMLDELTKEMGLEGETMADRLKNAQWRNINDAWEAHKVRNRIAHEGFSFPLNQRETKRIIGLYENVFREFGKI